MLRSHRPGEGAVLAVAGAGTRGVRAISSTTIVTTCVGRRGDDVAVEVDRATDAVVDALDRDRDSLNRVVARLIIEHEVRQDCVGNREDERENQEGGQLRASLGGGLGGEHVSSKGKLVVGYA